VVTVTEVIRVALPEHLMRPVAEPDCAGAATNGDLLLCARLRLEALRQANADKAAMARVGGGKNTQ
jgi:hypothetical protein